MTKLKMIAIYCLLMLILLQQGHRGHGSVPNERPNKGVQLYMAYELKIISNYSMIKGSQFYDVKQNNDSITDALWCQSANNGSDIGWWFYPNGTQVLPGNFGENSSPRPVFSNRSVGQIALARNDGLSKNEGFYICLIPDENGVNQTLVVGAYTDSNYGSNEGPVADSSMKFTLISARDSNPPVFDLTFNVTDGPPTDVTCVVDVNSINYDLSRSVLSGPGFVTQVTVTVRMRQGGTYQCTVSNARVDAGIIGSVTAMNITSTLFIQVTNTPTNLSATRLNTGLTHVKLSWSSMSENNEFEIFYHLYDTQTIKSAGTTTNLQFNITSELFFNQTYKFFILAYGNRDIVTLPSERSNAIILSLTNPSVHNFTAIPTTFGIEILWIPPSFSPTIYEVSYQCHRECEGTTLPLSMKTSNPYYNLTNINPGSYCNITIYGLYGNDSVNLTSESMITPSIAPTSSVSNVTLSSIEARSMRVSWHDVPCSGQNGPIIGYLLQYNNSTSSETVNITGEENREYILTQLTPYTNYTITIIAYNDGGTGPASHEVIQQTLESEPGVITDLMPNCTNISTITITWREPKERNGNITTYEIYYETPNGFHKYINTSKTQYIIENLLPHTNYIIGVRAYTIIGPGEWSNISTSTSNIPTVSYFFVAKLNDTAVHIIWQAINISGINHSYILYYSNQNGTCWSFFSETTSNIVISGLDPVLKYKFRLAMIILLRGMEYEGERVYPTLIGQLSQPAIISDCSEQTPQPTTTSVLSFDDIIIFALTGALGISLIVVAVLLLVICVLLKKKKSNNNTNISHHSPLEEFILRLPEDTNNKQEGYYASIPDIKPKIENEHFYATVDEQEYTTMQ